MVDAIKAIYDTGGVTLVAILLLALAVARVYADKEKMTVRSLERYEKELDRRDQDKD